MEKKIAKLQKDLNKFILVIEGNGLTTHSYSTKDRFYTGGKKDATDVSKARYIASLKVAQKHQNDNSWRKYKIVKVSDFAEICYYVSGYSGKVEPYLANKAEGNPTTIEKAKESAIKNTNNRIAKLQAEIEEYNQEIQTIKAI